MKNQKGIKNSSFFFLISFLFITSLLSIKTLKKVDTQDIRISGSELFSQNDVKNSSSLNFPVFVKPSNSGSSLGISKVINESEILKAL